MGAENIKRTLSQAPPRLTVRRCLFGKPDPRETRAYFNKQMSILDEGLRAKYNYDFINDSPLPGDYDWEPLDEEKSPVVFSKLYQSVSRITHPAWRGMPQDTPKLLPADVTDRSKPQRNVVHPTARRVLPKGCDVTARASTSKKRPNKQTDSPVRNRTATKRKLHQIEITDYFPEKKLKSASTNTLKKLR